MHNRWVDSGEELIWSLEAKTFPWPVVESVHDAAELLKCESPEIGALGQILTDESAPPRNGRVGCRSLQ